MSMGIWPRVANLPGSLTIAFSVLISIVTFSPAFTFSQLRFFVNMVSTLPYFKLKGICHLSIVLVSNSNSRPTHFFLFLCNPCKKTFKRLIELWLNDTKVFLLLGELKVATQTMKKKNFWSTSRKKIILKWWHWNNCE